MKLNNQPQRAVYVNPKQLEFLQAKQKRRTFVGGRGSGKSTVLGHQTRQEFNFLPRAKVFLAGLTYNQILTKTLPSAMDAWAQNGLVEYEPKLGYGHFVVGKRPPVHWIKPFQQPRNFENAISFLNGYCIEMLSLDRPDTARGGNYDGGHMDESALIKREVVGKVLVPMIRANKHRFSHYMHQTFCDYTSAAWLPQGQWIYETEVRAKEKPNEAFFLESTAYDNLAVLGAEYFANLKQELSQIEWDVEVMNMRLKKLPNSFYPNFLASRHCEWNTYHYIEQDNGLVVPTDSDCDAGRGIELSWDFNAAFTSFLVCQEHGNEARILNALFVKQSDTNVVDAAATLFCDTYEGHQCKHVTIWGDRNGNNKSAGSNYTFYEQIVNKLTARGWTCQMMVQGLDPDHRLKHFFLNEVLAETNPRLPIVRINQNKCKYLIISITQAPITADWKKDKTSEKVLVQQEKATHLSDCFDNWLYKKYANRIAPQAPTYQVYFLNGRD